MQSYIGLLNSGESIIGAFYVGEFPLGAIEKQLLQFTQHIANHETVFFSTFILETSATWFLEQLS